MMIPKPHRGGDSDPPPYTSLTVPDEEAAVVEQKWEAVVPRNWQYRKHHNLVFYCSPSVFHRGIIRRLLGDRSKHPHWRAKLCVMARNIPRLMRQGFHLSHDNLVPGSSEMRLNTTKNLEQFGLGSCWKHRRIYEFEDSAVRPDWVATLFVFAKTESVIANLSLCLVTPDTVTEAVAYRWDGGQVYQANSMVADISFNTLFNAMPTGGWWPLPKGNSNSEGGR